MKRLRTLSMTAMGIICLLALLLPINERYQKREQWQVAKPHNPQEALLAEIDLATQKNERLGKKAEAASQLTNDDDGTVIESVFRTRSFLQKARDWAENENLSDALRYLAAAKKEIAALDSFLKEKTGSD